MEKTENAEKKEKNQLPEKLNEVLSSDPQRIRESDHLDAGDNLINACIEKKQPRAISTILPVIKLLNLSTSARRKMMQYVLEERGDVFGGLQILSSFVNISSSDTELFKKCYFGKDFPQEKVGTVIDNGAADKVINHWCEQGDAYRAVLSSILLRDGNLTNEEIGKLTEAIEKMVIVA